MFFAGHEIIDIIEVNTMAFGVCLVISFLFIVSMFATDWGYYNDDIVIKIVVVSAILSMVFVINLMMPVHYDYVGTTKVNGKQLTKIADYGEGKKYTLKDGTSYVVYSSDTSHVYTKQKQTTYIFKRSQAKLLPIRRLFSGENIPERVKLEIVEPIHYHN
ncbi:hypothetical protein QUW35_00215 [Ligilactobacillus agilis]|uniref:hypothetical protein n=1 Tax=Ligilactobacillus agilis TaxID=1601 RepID=UPI0025A43EF7|nr:hypothetical protein [Ligilactobacillus agilis]MDM8279119.1 hypothetical protein [Ligilactobacillus agilis]